MYKLCQGIPELFSISDNPMKRKTINSVFQKQCRNCTKEATRTGLYFISQDSVPLSDPTSYN